MAKGQLGSATLWEEGACGSAAREAGQWWSQLPAPGAQPPWPSLPWLPPTGTVLLGCLGRTPVSKIASESRGRRQPAGPQQPRPLGLAQLLSSLRSHPRRWSRGPRTGPRGTALLRAAPWGPRSCSQSRVFPCRPGCPASFLDPWPVQDIEEEGRVAAGPWPALAWSLSPPWAVRLRSCRGLPRVLLGSEPSESEGWWLPRAAPGPEHLPGTGSTAGSSPPLSPVPLT